MEVVSMYHASVIAKWFLAYNKIMMLEQGADLISNLKLQKLLYYAQGVYLALRNDPLFFEDIVAWQHGPVVAEVYHQYKSNGSIGIELTEDFNFDSIDEDTTQILEVVYDEFAQYSAWKLRNMTHNETPWLETNTGDTIKNDSIKKYFLENYIE